MESKFIMGENQCPIQRSFSNKPQSVLISQKLESNFLELALNELQLFYCNFFDVELIATANSVSRINDALTKASVFNLFDIGGISKSSFVSFWALFNYIEPDVYIESGVFIGSSLWACLSASPKTKVVGIDPNLTKLRIPAEFLGTTKLIDNVDFSMLDIDNNTSNNTVVYFDDHINSAARIIQSFEKGIRYLILDDSQGIEGTVKKRFPAFPCIPFILHSDLIEPGDFIGWSFDLINPKGRPTYGIKKTLSKLKMKMYRKNYENLYVQFDQSLLEQCRYAKRLIKKVEKIPSITDFIVPNNYSMSPESAKFIIELHSTI